MRKPTIIIGGLILTVILLSIVRTVVSNSLSISGITLSKMDEELAYYKTENLKLSERYLLKASLTNVASEASQLGFVESKTNIVLSGKLPLAQR